MLEPFRDSRRRGRDIDSLKGPLRRALLLAPSAKALALVLLPLPLLAAVLAALVAGDVSRLGLAGGALGSFWGAAALAFRALVHEGRYFLGEVADPPALPLKLLSALLTALGSALAALAAGHDLPATAVFAALAAAGHVAFFGRDVRAPRIEVAVVDGVDTASVTQQLKQAYGRLRGIEAAAGAIAVPEFRERLARITGIGRSVLAEIERDPADAARARRFLNLYLDSAERITTEYARTHRKVRRQPLEENFRELLIELENTFTEQHRKLVDRDVLSLGVDIEVMNTRLKREGLG